MDPARATSPTGSQGSNDTPDLPHSMLFVPKFTKAREPRALNRDGTPVNPELNREPSPADVPPLPLPRASRAREGSPRARPSTSAEGTRIADLIAAQAGGARVIGTISRTLSPPSPAPSPASSTRTFETTGYNSTPSSEPRQLDPDEGGV